LESAPPYGELVKEIARKEHHIHYSVEPGKTDGLKHCKRPVLRFKVEDSLFDAFFNSHSGYRAQFLTDPNCGQAANGIVLDALREQLEAATEQATSPHEMESYLARASLRGVSAKIWLFEDEFDFRNPTEDLSIDSWKAAAVLGCTKAKWGLCAPGGSTLEVKGAFLDPYGHEVIAADKISRRFDIHMCGFS